MYDCPYLEFSKILAAEFFFDALLTLFFDRTQQDAFVWQEYALQKPKDPQF